MTPALWAAGLATAVAAAPCLVVEGATGPMRRLRGEPDSPALRDARARLPADMRALADAESHAATHVQCTYAVRVGADRYTVTWSWDTTLEDKADSWCGAAAPAVQADLLRTTRGCAELQAGAWWGHALVPAPAPPPATEAPDATAPAE